MALPRALLAVLVALAVAGVGCSSFRKAEIPSAKRQTKFTGTAFINAGSDLHYIVDVRASRIGGPKEFLPLQVALLNRSKDDLKINRESFSLEGPNQQLLPLVSYAEFEDNYPRHRIDLRIGNELIDALNGRYPSPPFTKRPLEFFPLRESGVVPRDEISLRQGELAVGYIYFRLPSDDFLPGPGACKLLLRPIDSDASFVIDLTVYKKNR